MRDRIADFLRSRKGQDVALVLTLLLVGVISFGLGRLSHEQVARTPVILSVPVEAMMTAHAIAGYSGAVLDSQISTPQPTVNTKAYVASKTGSAYHLPWCSGAQRIKEENKIWFDTKEAAEAAGYRPAANCKGL